MKKQILCLLLMSCLLLSGCSSINEYLEKQMLEESGIAEDGNYQTYQGYSESEKLTQQGYYSEDAFNNSRTESYFPENAAHITFAQNNYLEIEYFTDASVSTPIDTTACYLVPGEHLYATVSLNRNVASSEYTFAGFRLYQYDGNERVFIKTIEMDSNGHLFEVTDEHADSELSIEPIGNYETRIISLHDFYLNEDGTSTELSGTWTVNDKEAVDTEVEVSPIASYIISHEYDSDEYFYFQSTPECFYTNNEDGIVIFEQREAREETVDYSVELHKYVTASIESSQSRTVSVNGGAPQEISVGGTLDISKLKYGDIVTITTNKEWSALESYRELILQTMELSQGEYKYTLIVPQKGGEFVFDPSEYTYEHGSLVFKCFGEVVTTTQYLAAGTRITYEATAVEDGYWLADGEHVIIVGNEKDTRQALNNIKFTPQVTGLVALPQPEFGGKIHYFVDGKELFGSSYKAASGTEITMEFSPWEGWINNYTNGEKYYVTENSSQTVVIDGRTPVSNAFSEDPDHKPTLEVVLDKSVGENMKFTFVASGLDEDDYKYESEWYRNNYSIIKGQKIGTETGIVLSMGNRAIHSGNAIKILIEKKDSEGSLTTTYRLVDDLTELQAPILIYENGDNATSEVWYESIKVTISVVEVMTFTAPTVPQNASITVRNVATSQILKTGDIIEGDEKVSITISPYRGHYVAGKNVSNDIFQDTMKFSKYQENIKTILSDHPIEKYYYATLNATDTYGVCTFKLDGKAVSGSVRFKEGQELKLEYEITSTDYVIADAKGFLFGIGKNEKEKSETIKLTHEFDGKTISRDTFGIMVVKGE